MLREISEYGGLGYGLWDDELCWSLSDLKGKAEAEAEGLHAQAIDSLAAGVCPVCGEP